MDWWTVSARILCPWYSLSKNTAVGCHFLLQGMFPTQGLNLHLLLGRWILYHWATWEAPPKHKVSTQEMSLKLELNLAGEGLEAVLATVMWMGLWPCLSLPSPHPHHAFMLPNNLSQIGAALKPLAVSQGRIQHFPGESPCHRHGTSPPTHWVSESEGHVFAATNFTTVVSIALVKSC